MENMAIVFIGYENVHGGFKQDLEKKRQALIQP